MKQPGSPPAGSFFVSGFPINAMLACRYQSGRWRWLVASRSIVAAVSLAALLPARRVALWRALLRHALAAAPDRAAAAGPFERMSSAALAAKKNGIGGRNRSSNDSDDDLDGFAEARLMGSSKRKKKEEASAAAAPSAFPPLHPSEACASLRSFIRRFVVPGVDGRGGLALSSSSSTSTFGGVSLDELTLRARGAERALAAGAKAGQSVI